MAVTMACFSAGCPGLVVCPQRNPYVYAHLVNHSGALEKPKGCHGRKRGEEPPNSRVMVLTLSVGRNNLSAITRRQLERYCERHGYSLRSSNVSWDVTRALPWSKVPFLLHAMEHAPNFDYYMWVDDDIFISDLNCEVTAIIAPYAERCTSSSGRAPDFFVSQDVVDYSPFNTGLLVVRQSAAARSLLRDLYANGGTVKACGRHGLKQTSCERRADWEQSTLARMYSTNAIVRSSLCVVPTTVLQSLYRSYGVMSKQLWSPTGSHFSAHVTGMLPEERLRFARCAEMRWLKAQAQTLDSRTPSLVGVADHVLTLALCALTTVIAVVSMLIWRAATITGVWQIGTACANIARRASHS
jgi:hypothetical protein